MKKRILFFLVVVSCSQIMSQGRRFESSLYLDISIHDANLSHLVSCFLAQDSSYSQEAAFQEIKKRKSDWKSYSQDLLYMDRIYEKDTIKAMSYFNEIIIPVLKEMGNDYCYPLNEALMFFRKEPSLKNADILVDAVITARKNSSGKLLWNSEEQLISLLAADEQKYKVLILKMMQSIVERGKKTTAEAIRLLTAFEYLNLLAAELYGEKVSASVYCAILKKCSTERKYWFRHPELILLSDSSISGLTDDDFKELLDGGWYKPDSLSRQITLVAYRSIRNKEKLSELSFYDEYLHIDVRMNLLKCSCGQENEKVDPSIIAKAIVDYPALSINEKIAQLYIDGCENIKSRNAQKWLTQQYISYLYMSQDLTTKEEIDKKSKEFLNADMQKRKEMLLSVFANIAQ